MSGVGVGYAQAWVLHVLHDREALEMLEGPCPVSGRGVYLLSRARVALLRMLDADIDELHAMGALLLLRWPDEVTA